ncbi:MAG: SRPBCC family protein, partial [Terriglobales bacterium]
MPAIIVRTKFPAPGLLAGLALGATAAFFADPKRGRRRRAQARDCAHRNAHRAADAVVRSLRDLSHRSKGIIANALDLVMSARVSDEVLGERVRSRLGRLVSHPSAIEVRVVAGTVMLRGDVLAAEMPQLREGLEYMSGVREVIDQLTLHDSPEHVPSMQAHRSLRRPTPEILRDRWTPATRAIAGASGIGLLLASLASFAGRRRGAATAIGISGAGLLLRSITNVGPLEGMGIDRDAPGVTVQKTTTIHAPVERVFDLLVNPDKLPRVMDHVREVKKMDDTHYHWTVIGPAGTPLSWDSEITRLIPNELLAWRSGPGAAVKNEGVVQFQPSGDGGTRVQIRMRYMPPGGFVGHSIAELLD